MSDFDFSIGFLDQNGNPVQVGPTGWHWPTPFTRSDRRTFYSINYDHNVSGTWDFNSNSSDGKDKILYYENFHFGSDPNLDLSDYTLVVVFNPKDGQSIPEQPSWLSIGGGAMQGTIVNTNQVHFKLDDPRIKDIVSGGADPGIKQFTFIPYDKTENEQYFGKRFASINFSPYTYQVKGDGGIATKDNNKNTYELTSSDIKAKEQLGWTNNALTGIDLLGYPGFKVAIGGIADVLLSYNLGNGPVGDQDLYHLQIDEAIDTNQKLLSQSILVKYEGSDPKYQNLKNWTEIQLDNSRQWAVTGNLNQGLIDGMNRRPFLDNFNLALQDQNQDLISIYEFENTMLQLQSSHGSGKDISNYNPATNPDDRAIAVAGVTFKDSPKRRSSGIQLNYDDGYNWYIPKDTGKTFSQNYSDRIFQAIDQYAAGQPVTKFYNNQGNTIAPVWMFDTQMFTWSDGSDGPEVRSPKSYFERNYQMTPDDNIHVLSNSSNWKDITLIQGNTGSPISIGSYGFTNGAVFNNTLDNINIPRIAQSDSFDGVNGVISNKSAFGTPLISPNGAGIFGNTMTTLKIDSWEYDSNVGNQNEIVDSGVFSALNYNQFNPLADSFIDPINGFATAGQSYAMGSNNFGTIEIPTEVFQNETVKQILYAFGGANDGIKYSAINAWPTNSSGDVVIPYFAHNNDALGFIVTYTRADESLGTQNFLDLRPNTYNLVTD